MIRNKRAIARQQNIKDFFILYIVVVATADALVFPFTFPFFFIFFVVDNIKMLH